MATLTLTTVQSQYLTSMEAKAAQAFEDGVVAPGGTPALLPPFAGYKDYTLEQKGLGLNALKSTFAPFLASAGAAPVYSAVVFENGFSLWGDPNYGEGAVRYTKDMFGYVLVRGLMRTPAAGPTNGLAAFTFPVGFRPSPNDRSIFACVAGDTFCSVEINNLGQMALRSVPANDTWVSLEVRFYAGA